MKNNKSIIVEGTRQIDNTSFYKLLLFELPSGKRVLEFGNIFRNTNEIDSFIKSDYFQEIKKLTYDYYNS